MNYEDPDIYCNPIEWLDEAEEGLAKWAKEKIEIIIYGEIIQ